MPEFNTSSASVSAPADAAVGTADNRWRIVVAACVVVTLGLIGLFWSTAEGMVYIWYNFETYTHGFIILPISLWLIWQKRRHLAAFTPQPTASLLVILVMGLIVWALARLTGVQVVEQAAFVGMIIASVASLIGLQVARFLAFPLLFLFFAVPMGEDLIPPMMEFTATFTVGALKLTGIPVYRDGLWFSLPSGDWSVVEACSGVRYLIASATLGVMYAYITYHTLWKRLLFIAMSIIVPILANGVRAYIIVMIGHLSNMKYASGVDHLIYGWVFFGIVMFILFWVGSFWQEDQAPPEKEIPPRRDVAGAIGAQTATIVVGTLLFASVAVALTQRAENVDAHLVGKFTAPDAIGEWQLTAEGPGWTMQHQPTDHVLEATYRRGDQAVDLFVALFPQQTQGAEAISKGNQISENLVRSVNLGRETVSLGADSVDANRLRAIIPVEGGAREHLVWQWYRVAGHSVTNRYAGKAWEAIARIYPGRADGAWIAVATPAGELDVTEAGKRLADFTAALGPEIAAEIDRFIGGE